MLIKGLKITCFIEQFYLIRETQCRGAGSIIKITVLFITPNLFAFPFLLPFILLSSWIQIFVVVAKMWWPWWCIRHHRQVLILTAKSQLPPMILITMNSAKTSVVLICRIWVLIKVCCPPRLAARTALRTWYIHSWNFLLQNSHFQLLLLAVKNEGRWWKKQYKKWEKYKCIYRQEKWEKKNREGTENQWQHAQILD